MQASGSLVQVDIRRDPVAGSCNAASGSLVDVDIPELSESPWPGSDIF